MPPRTIDNLGVDVSTRYAEDQKLLDETLIREARAIPTQTEIDVSIPSFSSEIESLLHSQVTHIPWALFKMPNGYLEQKKKLFTFQLIPALGSDEKKESQMQKILAKLRTLADKRREPQGKEQKEEQRQKKREAEQEEKEKTILISLLDTITTLDKFLVEINSRRSQYQKG